jgi:hypothetical protein
MADKAQPSIDYAQLEQMLQVAKNSDGFYQQIVNVPFNFKAETAFLFLGIVMLALVNGQTKNIEAKAISTTDFVEEIDSMAAMPIDQVFIPLRDDKNLLVQAIKEGEAKNTNDWSYLLRPVMNAEQARFTQASGGIAFTEVHPLKGTGDGGVLVYSFFDREGADAKAQDEFTAKYTEIVTKALAR